MLKVDVRQVEGVLIQSLVPSAGGHVLHLAELAGAPGGAQGHVLGVTAPHHVSLRHILASVKLMETLLEGRHYASLDVDNPERILTGVADRSYPTIIKSKVDCVPL